MPSLVNQMIIEEMKKDFEKNHYAFISTFDGLPVSSIAELRRSLEKCANRSMLVKHTLARKAFDSLSLNGTEAYLKSQVLVTLGDKDPQAISKVLMDFAKSNNQFSPTAVVFEKKLYDGTFVKSLSQLPSRHELLTQLVVRVKSPISGFVITLNQLLRGFVVAINEIKKKKESASASA